MSADSVMVVRADSERYVPLPCHVVSIAGEHVTHITAKDRDMTPLVTLTPDQAEEVAGYLLNHAANVRRNTPANGEPEAGR